MNIYGFFGKQAIRTGTQQAICENCLVGRHTPVPNKSRLPAIWLGRSAAYTHEVRLSNESTVSAITIKQLQKSKHIQQQTGTLVAK